VKKEPPVAHGGDEHGVRNGSTRPDTVLDTVLSSAPVVTVTHVVCVLGCLVALVLHVPSPVCAVSCVDGTQDRGHRAWWQRGRGQSRVGHTSSAFNPALGPWSRVKRVGPAGTTASVGHMGRAT
jgi:hypothetical protein